MQLRSTLIFFSALAMASATPLLRPRCSSGTKSPTPGYSNVTWTLPSSGGADNLPSPNKTVKYITVGHGVQNYTCASAGAQPVSVGALAVLYDTKQLYPGSGGSALAQSDWDSLTSTVLRTTAEPIVPGKQGYPFPPATALRVPGVSGVLPYRGVHYFNGPVPTFALNNNTEILAVQKVKQITAPDGSDAGLQNEGAVDWLFLADSAGNDVYRVVTAGGSPGPCMAANQTQSVDYAAMYWMF